MRECSVEGCEKVVIARGWCTTHYKRWARNGHIKTDYYKGEGDDTEYFIGLIDKSGSCWEWNGAINDSGYGHVPLYFTRKYNESLAHRVSYIIHKGNLPKWDNYGDSLCVMHTCDNPSCVNPDHLILGTHQDNMKDRDTKLRHLHGERHHSTKFTETDVLSIRDRLSNGERPADIAREQEVTFRTIALIRDRLTWKHL